MPYPDPRYGPKCRTSELLVVRLDFGAGEALHEPFNVRAVRWLLRATARVRAYNEAHPKTRYRIRDSDTGTYNCRDATGSSSPSIHSWGLAIDVNWRTNPYSKYGDYVAHDIPGWFVRAFTLEGFVWGGSWTAPKDYMHFQRTRWAKPWDGEYPDWRRFKDWWQDAA